MIRGGEMLILYEDYSIAFLTIHVGVNVAVGTARQAVVK